MESSSQRKLAAILFADIQGYTSLMQKDEKHASELLRRFQQQLTWAVDSFNGQIINFYGDGALCIFDNPLEAVRCAMAFQKTLQNPAIPVRVGIHLGTIVRELGKAFGDSINIASRIESMAVPGSIFLSKRVYEELKNQPDLAMHSLGKYEFKNVEDPMEVFALSAPGLIVPKRDDLRPMSMAQPFSFKIRRPILTIVSLALLMGVVALSIYYSRSDGMKLQPSVSNTLQRLAVLPFTNLRDDPDSDFLGLALADEIIGDLSYIKEVLVRPSSAVRKYAKTVLDAPTIGNELKVDYILVGNYLREGSLIRMDIELVGVQTNDLVWRGEIEESYQDAFLLQDIVSEKILEGLKIQFSEGERDRRQADMSSNPLAYEYYLRGLAQPSTIEGNRIAVDLLNQSIDMDSLFAPAWSEIGWRIKQLAAFTIGEGHQISLAEQKLEKALALNKNLLSAHSILITIYVETGRMDKAIETANHALEINSNSAENHLVLGYIYRYSGFLAEAAEQEEMALLLEPDNSTSRIQMGLTQIYLENYQEALLQFQRSDEGPYSLAWQGQIYLRLGDEEHALNIFDRVIESDQEGVGHWVSAMKCYLEGTQQEGLSALKELEKNLVDPEQIYNIANLYGLLGFKELCITNLRKAVSRGFFSYPVFLTDPFLDSVRDEPEFQDILEEARIKHESFGKRYF